ncbi:DsbA family oxidoreductase [Reinekea thalattae]|uniref:DsbA family oxidoreductase n=1 Tax=Reinekea thalattae TaxID=2593301 RepID=A0A5C8ZBT2_9GAMM|nr:DsbA family oxidoreductase [Reinekea thalattae]TXR54658.1 DsbA family oxidoreductase [Reinekea thalattae]
MSKMTIDIVSDVMCPWCIIGYKNLEAALEKLPNIETELQWQPFELNPNMPPEGQQLLEHVMEKYGSTPEQSQQSRQMLKQRGKECGFEFNTTDDSRIINSFDCHRLLAWAKEQGQQTELKLALFKAHFTDGKKLNDDEQLLDVAASIGLDRDRAAEILKGDEYKELVKQEESAMHQLGINSVPTFIINQKYAISGGQPVDVFYQSLQQIANEAEQA